MFNQFENKSNYLMKIIKGLITISFLINMINFTRGQGTQNSFIYNSSETGIQVHVACKSIEFKPGYYYNAQGSSMNSYIDPNIICDVVYSEDEFSPSDLGTHNTDLPVGSTSGTFDVSPTGAGTYNIPLISAPGTMGMIPNLSVNYNSQAGNGLMGIGWMLSGSCLSAISRTSQNEYYDSNVSPVSLNNNDRFMLDGSRLLLVSENNGLDGSIYNTEVENFAKIISHGQTGDGPAYFTVETKDGTKLDYGRTSDSYIEPSGGANSTALTWLLNKITDSNGNFINIYYFEDNSTGEFRIDHIDYTGNDLEGITPYNKIKFVYEQRTDKQIYFVSGYHIKQSVLLSGVQMYAEGSISRNYEFKYSYDENVGSHLSEVIEIGVDGKQYNSIKIGWSINTSFISDPNDNTGEKTLGTFPSPSFANIEYTGDFNGDGFTDYFIVHTKTDWDPGTTWELYLNNGGSGFTSSPSSSGSMPPGYKKTISAVGDGRKKGIVVDVDGNGKDDIFLYGITGNSEYFGVLWNGTDWDASTTYSPPAGAPALQANGTPQPDARHFELVGDFNGDGHMDLFLYYFVKDKWYILGADCEGSGTGWGNENLTFHTVDFDGDGKDEIMFTYHRSNDPHDDYNYVLGLDIQSKTLDTLSHGDFPNSCEGNNIYTGDFNGDGKTDLLTYDYCSNVWFISYAIRTSETGTKAIQYATFAAPFSPYPTNPNPSNSIDLNEYLVADYNGDGKSDIVIFYSYYNFTTDQYIKFLEIYYSIGNNLFKYEHRDLPNNNMPISSSHSFIGDFNGDGHLDIMHNTGNPHEHVGIYFLCSGDGGEVNYTTSIDYNKVTSITNGFDETFYINYNTLPVLANTGDYIKGTSSIYPLMDLQKPLSVVSQRIGVDGIGGLSTTYPSDQVHIA